MSHRRVDQDDEAVANTLSGLRLFWYNIAHTRVHFWSKTCGLSVCGRSVYCLKGGLHEMGYRRMMRKSDQEPSIRALRWQVQRGDRRRGGDTSKTSNDGADGGTRWFHDGLLLRGA